ncbi:hypothetical protein B0H14DRAFT_3516093 [Mycena olivaceomarginata]|nr:hypothetical protein B0H14DRAFT_3516093 [Mycena olivaceomarginata]
MSELFFTRSSARTSSNTPSGNDNRIHGEDLDTEPEARVRDVTGGWAIYGVSAGVNFWDSRGADPSRLLHDEQHKNPPLQIATIDHVHPSKWPFALVYMDDVPKNAAGKPLRIKLAARLGLDKLSDAIPPFQRHYEAARRDLPSKEAALSEPIPCACVALDLNAIYTALTGVYASPRPCCACAPEAFVAAHEVDTSDIAAALTRVLPGYTVPSPIHMLAGRHTLLRMPLGKPDYAGMEAHRRARARIGDERARAACSEATLNMGYDYEEDVGASQEKVRGQCHPVSMIVQALPFVFFYPLKTALTYMFFSSWTVLLLMLSVLAPHITGSFWERIASLMCAIVVARLIARIVAPVTSILFKWLVIGRYKPGTYRMSSTYHLRWWIVNQSLRIAGRGIFAMHPALEILYYRLLGTRVSRNVRMDKGARLGKYDLLTFCDGCRVDTALMRGFAVEHEGYFRLDKVVIGEKAVVNTFTQIAPGARIPNGAVYGPHASSHDSPSPRSYAAFNRTLLDESSSWLKLFVAWLVMFAVCFVSYIPWLVAVWLMVDKVTILTNQLNALEAVVYWFSSPERVVYYALSRVVRAVFTSILQLILGILVKRLFELNKECATADASQLSLLRRYINGHLLSKTALKAAFSILGTHYEVVSVVYRCVGAKIGKRVYWPGSGLYCLDPELLEISNDVVFGLCSEVFATDRIGTGCVCVADGAMIADRVVLLPGCKVGRRTVMGFGALGMRDTEYRNGWLGLECLDEGMSSKFDDPDTTTPFGRAFYRCKADYFVFPYTMILFVNVMVATLSATYWSINAVAAAQMLRQFHLRAHHLHICRPVWYRPGVIFGVIAVSFVIILNLQALSALLWVVVTKWVVIGRRRDGHYVWDKSSYCQRWQLHLTLPWFIYKGCGNSGVLAPITGTVYLRAKTA